MPNPGVCAMTGAYSRLEERALSLTVDREQTRRTNPKELWLLVFIDFGTGTQYLFAEQMNERLQGEQIGVPRVVVSLW